MMRPGAPSPAADASPSSRRRATIATGGERVIYLICKDGEILVETDNLNVVRRWVAADGECTVRDARTGKKIAVEAATGAA